MTEDLPLYASIAKRVVRGLVSTVACTAGVLLLMSVICQAEPGKTVIFYSSSGEPLARAITAAVSAADYELKQQNLLVWEQFCSADRLVNQTMVLSTREIAPHNEEECSKNNLGSVAKAELGFVTLVLVQKASDPPMRLSSKQLYLALAEFVPGKEGMELSKNTKWSDVDAMLPALPAKVILPATGTSTRSIFDGEAMVAGCRDFPVIKRIFEAPTRTATCVKTRNGVVVETADAAARLDALKQAGDGSVALVPDSVFEANKNWLRVIPFNGLMPNPEDVVSEDYTLTAPVYLYAHADQVSGDSAIPSVRNWFLEAISERAIGENGYLDQYGFTSLPAASREWQRKPYTE